MRIGPMAAIACGAALCSCAPPGMYYPLWSLTPVPIPRHQTASSGYRDRGRVWRNDPFSAGNAEFEAGVARFNATIGGAPDSADREAPRLPPPEE